MVLYHSKIFNQPIKSSSQPLIYRHVEIWQVSLHSRLYLANSPQVDLLVWGLLLALLRERFFSAWLSSSSTHSSISTTLALAFPLLLILLWRGYFVDILLHKVPVEYTYTDMYLHILFGRSLCVSAKCGISPYFSIQRRQLQTSWHKFRSLMATASDLHEVSWLLNCIITSWGFHM